MGKRKRTLAMVAESTLPASQTFPLVGVFPMQAPQTKQEGIAFKLYRHEEKGNQNMLVGSAPGISYTGQTHGHSTAQPCRYAVAEYSKSSNTLRLLPVLGGRVNRIGVQLHSLDYGPSEHNPELYKSEGVDRDVRMAERIAAISEFGSQRIKRELVRREAHRVTDNVRGGAAANMQSLARMVDASNSGRAVLTAEQRAEKSVSARPMPPHHPEAVHGRDAFVLKELVPSTGWAALPVAKLLKFAFWLEAPPEAGSDDAGYLEQLRKKFGHYVTDRATLLNNMAGAGSGGGDPVKDKSPAGRERVYRARCLGYLDVLLKLSRAGQVKVVPDEGGLAGTARKLRVKEELLEPLLSRFYPHPRDGEDGTLTYRCPTDVAAQLRYHVLVAAVLAEDCELAPGPFFRLASELKVQPSALAADARYLGCLTKKRKLTAEELPGMSAAEQLVRESSSYTVTLLRAGNGKTLRECFPRPSRRGRVRG